MHKNYNDVEIAVSAIEQLEDMHQRFMDFIKSLSATTPHAGVLGVKDNNITAICLSVPLTVKRKIVAKDSHPSFIEYAFVFPQKDVDIVVFTLYLGPDGNLFTDPLGEINLCDFNNNNLATYLLNSVAISLLDSDVFKPTTNG